MNTLLLLVWQFFKFAKLSKILLSLGSIALTLGTYALTFGWYYAAGIVFLILIHESGHYFAAKQKQLAVGLPIFIPFVGAWIELESQPMNAETEAYIAYAGPFIGTLGAFSFYYFGRYYHSSLALALAQTGFLINLFNLIPLHPLDGGRITGILSPRVWLLGVPMLIMVWLYQPSPVLILIAILAIPQVIKAWRYDSAAPENKHYYAINSVSKIEYAILYLSLVVVLSLMIYSLS